MISLRAMFPKLLATCLLPLLTSCVSVAPAVSYPAVDVRASAETVPVGTVAQDAADDPAIWRNAADPAQSLIIGTDKKAGLYVYDLSGRVRSFTAAGEVNNVDLRDSIMWRGQPILLVGASNRADLARPALNLYALDPTSGGMTLLASQQLPTNGEAYGFCFGRISGEAMPHAYVVTKQGQVLEIALSDGGDDRTPAMGVVRSFTVSTQPEGCVVDDRTGQLYLGEEDVGIWRFDLRSSSPQPIPFAMVGSTSGLVADVEGLAIAPSGERDGYLVASSQGDNAYAIFDLASAHLIGRFRVGSGGEATEDTDGIELMLGDFGPTYPNGLLVVQDGNNAPEAQNFKLLSWVDVRNALSIAHSR